MLGVGGEGALRAEAGTSYAGDVPAGQGVTSMVPAPIPPQRQLTCMLGHPVAASPIDRMFDAVFAHHGMPWRFWKCDVASEATLPAAWAGVRARGC
jgi:hypothetical protein